MMVSVTTMGLAVRGRNLVVPRVPSETTVLIVVGEFRAATDHVVHDFGAGVHDRVALSHAFCVNTSQHQSE